VLKLDQINLLIKKVQEAGDIAISLQKQGLKVENKPDGSLVTNADKTLDKFLTNVIREDLKNNDLIISEEDVAEGNSPTVTLGQSFWSIDPIDSTKSFINNNPFYCITIAYIENQEPTFGIIYAPATKELWYGAKDLGAFKIVGNELQKQITTRKIPSSGALLMSSEEQITRADIIEKLNIVEELKIPSAIKFCYIADGRADYYVRKRNKACDWDISAGHAIILSAGGVLNFVSPDENFQYGIPPYLAPCLIAKGDTSK
jgi:3'(2'), 5'-bisphosphate nucleotidase